MASLECSACTFSATDAAFTSVAAPCGPIGLCDTFSLIIVGLIINASAIAAAALGPSPHHSNSNIRIEALTAIAKAIATPASSPKLFLDAMISSKPLCFCNALLRDRPVLGPNILYPMLIFLARGHRRIIWHNACPSLSPRLQYETSSSRITNLGRVCFGRVIKDRMVSTYSFAIFEQPLISNIERGLVNTGNSPFLDVLFEPCDAPFKILWATSARATLKPSLAFDDTSNLVRRGQWFNICVMETLDASVKPLSATLKLLRLGIAALPFFEFLVLNAAARPLKPESDMKKPVNDNSRILSVLLVFPLPLGAIASSILFLGNEKAAVHPSI